MRHVLQGFVRFYKLVCPLTKSSRKSSIMYVNHPAPSSFSCCDCRSGPENVWTHPAFPYWIVFVSCHGNNLRPPPSHRHTEKLLPLPTNPNTAMFVGQPGGQRGERKRLEGESWDNKNRKCTRKKIMRELKNKWQKRGNKSQKETCTENRKRVWDGFTSRGMSFPLISCNRTNGIRRGGYSC